TNKGRALKVRPEVFARLQRAVTISPCSRRFTPGYLLAAATAAVTRLQTLHVRLPSYCRYRGKRSTPHSFLRGRKSAALSYTAQLRSAPPRVVSLAPPNAPAARVAAGDAICPRQELIDRALVPASHFRCA